MAKKSEVGIEHIRKAVHFALRAWDRLDSRGIDDLANLILFRREVAGTNQTAAEKRRAINHILTNCLNELEGQQPDSARLIRRRFLESNSIQQLAFGMHIGEDQFNRRQRDAIQALSQLLLSKEQALRAEHREELLARLPPRSYQRLYGVERIQAALGELLLAARSPGVLALAGLGGIGKTAIADSVIRGSFAKFPFMDVIWLRVQSPVTNPSIVWERIWAQLAGYLLTNPTPVLEYPQALRKAFKEFPRLVVIDNLEDDLFHADWHFWLREFANPSKFLLTTRVLPNSMADVHVVKVSELKPEAAKDLLLDHAEKLGLKTSLSALRKNAANIYEHTGGNPLALKLVVGLLHVWPLLTILRALQQGPGSDVEGMYRGIYQHSWRTLSGNARQLLQAMPLAGEEGATIEQLGAVSELQEIELREAVKELASRSLLEMRNSIGETRYGIHHLTQTFLHSQIVNQL